MQIGETARAVTQEIRQGLNAARIGPFVATAIGMRSGELSAFLPFQRRNGGFPDFLRLPDFPGFAECGVHPAQKIHAVCLSNGSSRSHRALEGSSLPSCFVLILFLTRLATPALRYWGYWVVAAFGVLCISTSLRTQVRPAIEFVSGKEGLRPRLPVFAGIPAFMLYDVTVRVLVFFKFGYWDTLNFASAPGLPGGRGEMAMAVASFARLAFLRGAVCASTLYTRCCPFLVPVQ